MGLLVGVGCAVIGIRAGLSASETVVGINFRRTSGETEMPVTDSAGVVVVQTNWNNSDGSADGTTANISTPISGKIVDSTGKQTGLTIAWDYDGSWSAGNSGNADERLMDGYLDNHEHDHNTCTVSVAGISAESFDVYVYFGSNADNRQGLIGIDGSDTYSFNTHSSGSKSFPGAYLRTTDTGSGYPDANYAVWSNLTGSAFTISQPYRAGANSGIHGMQIVITPPSSGTLFIFM